MAEKKEKQYVSDNAQLMAEWDWEKNTDLDPATLLSGSGKNVWWKCIKGHEWQATPNSRTSKTPQGCPYCSNHRILVGFNDLATTHPNLAYEWHPTKNGELTPEQVTYGSHKKVWWICENKHEFEASISNRTKRKGCPYCSGHKVISGTNDLLSKFPNIAKEWHPTRNGSLTPNNVSFGSDKKAWWICDKGHEYIASPNARTSNKTGCPYCNGRTILRGFNDLSTLFPQISSEWCYAKNTPVLPDMVFPHSKKKYWWICPACGAEYLAAVENRVNGTSCPQCASRHHTSFAEQAIYFYIHKIYPDSVNRYTKIYNNQMELDIYIPTLKIGIEYDGCFWHESDSSYIREQQKYKRCKELGIYLVRVREQKSSNDDLICDFSIVIKPYRKNLSGLNTVIERIFKLLHLQCDIDVVRDESEIKSTYYTNLQEQSILQKNPQLVMEWDYEKNGDLRPEMVSVGSADKVWWKCSKGHSWQSAVYNRSKGVGCPYCRGTQVIVGENDLASLYPNLIKEWDFHKNIDISPAAISPGSNKHVWWICQKGHSWKASIYSRTSKNTGCPYCSNNLCWSGYNDLQTLYPQLALEWDYLKNGDLTPNNVVAGSTKKVWWKCTRGHEWEAQIRVRVRGNGCPECKGINSSIRQRMTTETFIAKVKTKNPNIKIVSNYINSKTKVNCQCLQCNAQWIAYPSNLLKGHGCPECARQKRKKKDT